MSVYLLIDVSIKQSYLFWAISCPSNEKMGAPEVTRPPVSSMLSQEVNRSWPLILTIGFEEVNGKGADKISFSLGWDMAGKNAL